MKPTIGVFFGGHTVEHEVSIISGLQALHAIDRNQYDVLPVYISKEGDWYTGEVLSDIETYKQQPESYLAQCQKVNPSGDNRQLLLLASPARRFRDNTVARVDVAMVVIHGTGGEDGCLQGLLDMLGVPYTGCNVLASALGMDKTLFKAALKAKGLPVIESIDFTYKEWLQDPEPLRQRIAEELGYPLIVKPANLGSSIGIQAANSEEELSDALEFAGSFSRRILIERMLSPLQEINCSVLGDADEAQASVCEEPLRSGEFLSFTDKYESGGKSKGMSGTERRLPADISLELTQGIQETAVRTFKTIDAAGVARIDFLVDQENGQFYVNEINTIPGSLSFYLWEASGLDFTALTGRLIELALKRQREQDKLVTTYTSNILAQGSLGFKNK